jgi:uncharacterized Zn-binding protein involved in type VI secretion
MPAVARIGDLCSGHGCYPPRIAIAGSGNVFIDGRAAHRCGDGWITHGSGSDCPEHDGILSGCSGSVNVNGSGLGRTGDAISCGSTVAAGSSTVFAGD